MPEMPPSLLPFLLAACLTHIAHVPTTHTHALATGSSASSAGGGSANSGSDVFLIRHGRSRVRHSNDKDHLRRGLKLLTNWTLDVEEDPILATETALTDPLPATVTPTPTPTTTMGTTLAPVTHKIRKLHKKKIMESIRRSVEDKGVRLPKNHRSLAVAEHMQGRVPETLDELRADDELRANEELKADNELKADDELLNEMEAAGQEDDDDDGFLSDDFAMTAVAPVAETTTERGRIGHEVDVFGTSWPETGDLDTEAGADGESEDKPDVILVGAPTTDASTPDPHWLQTTTEGTSSLRGFRKQQTESKHKQSFLEDSMAIADTDRPEEPTEATKYKEELASSELKELESSDPKEPESLDSKELVSTDPEEEEDEDEPDYELSSTESSVEATALVDWVDEAQSLGPSQSASTSIGGIGLDRQQSMELEEISFEDGPKDPSDDGSIDSRDNGISDLNVGGVGADDDLGETNKFLEGVVDGANEDEIYDWDEISRNNRRNLMRGRDVVTKFLQIVETQHSLGSNCEAGTSLNLGEGVVDRYAQDRFRVEAEVAVNRANMLTRIFKMTSPSVQASVNLLHASVLSMVEFDDDIFAGGNCFDWNQHPSQPGLFCPFAYRLPPPNLGAIFAKDLATEYHYLGNTSEWFFQARKNAEKVIARNEQYLKAFHLYSNKTDERIEENTLAVKYEDGRWSKPYYDCGGGNIWMLTYTVPFFGYENGTYFFKGTSGIDIDLRRVDIDQCPQRNTPGTSQPLNIFAGTDKCKQRTTMCEALKGLGFRRGSYKCVCRKGYYFPDTMTTQKYFNGSLLEEEYEKLMLGRNSTYNIVAEYECLPCAEGCDSCEDGSPCIAALNWPMRTSILVLACTVIGLLPPAAWFTFRYQQVKVVRAASPALLRVIALGAFFIYCTTIVMYPNPNLYTCTARIWLREIGFSLTYGALMLKTWRISVIFRVRSAKAVKITDAALLKRLGVICGVIGTCLLVRTLVSPPDVVVGRTADDLKAFLCKTDYWDHTFTSMEVLFLAWGVRLCIMVRKAPSEFNESRFISMAIYNEFLLTCFLNVSMLFLQSPANPDLLYIIFFCHTQLTVTLLLGLIFGSKVYIVLRSGKSHQESIGMGAKSSGAKFNFRPQVRTFANPSSVTTSTAHIGGGTTSAETKLSDQEALEEIRQLSVQLQRIQEMAPPKGVAVMTISSLLDGLKTPGGMMMVAAAANQMSLKHPAHHPPGSLPLLAINSEIHKYNQLQLQPQNNNLAKSNAELTVVVAPPPAASTLPQTPMPTATPSPSPNPPKTTEERSMNTSLTGDDFLRELLQAHAVCSRCLEACRGLRSEQRCPSTPTLCQRLGSPQPEGSISFSNIKLDCMCSQPDDLDLDRHPPRSATPTQRRVNYRTAATNTPPSLNGRRSRRTKDGGSRFQHGSSSSLSEAAPTTAKTTMTMMTGDRKLKLEVGDTETFQICDNCKNKLSSKNSSSRSSRTVVHEEPSSSSTTNRRLSVVEQSASGSRGHDLLDSNNSSDADGDEDVDHVSSSSTVRRKDEEKTTEAEVVVAGCCPSETTSVGSANGDAKPNGRSKRPDKLMLDLNDRSKYTKEVSV